MLGKRYFWRCVQISCSVAFIVQICFLIKDQIKPHETKIFKEEKYLRSIDFPILIKLCFQDAFNHTQLNNTGYNSVFDYFLGQSFYDKNIFGWAGHTSHGTEGAGIKGMICK